MNLDIIKRWNTQVSDDDEVVVLGDVALGKIAESLPLVSRLRGNKFLLPGNHDRCHPHNNKKYSDWRVKYEDVGFTILPIVSPAKIGGHGVLLCHFPYAGHEKDERDHLTKYHPAYEDTPLVHGHVHDLYRANGNMINVGMDAWGGELVPEESIIIILDHIKEHGPELTYLPKVNWNA